MTLYKADCIGNPANCIYPYKCEVHNTHDFRKAIDHDYVCVAYRNNYRGNENFLSSDCLSMDCDNDHSDRAEDWVTVEDVRIAFPGVAFAVHYSRNHLKEKNGKAARPRFHILFPIEPVTDAEQYANLKKTVHSLFPFFDNRALDAARFFFGTENANVEIVQGQKCLTDFLQEEAFAHPDEGQNEIPAGARNDTMFRFAVKILKRYGTGGEAENAFREMSLRCNPPLPDSELRIIWHSANKFYEKIRSTPDYTPPEQYNAEPAWDAPLPLTEQAVLPFPVDALPKVFADFARAHSACIQTPVDMAGAISLSVMSVALQGKYVIEGKPHWQEPLNTYILCIAAPSERKSSVLNPMLKPISKHEEHENVQLSQLIEMQNLNLSLLEKKKKTLTDAVHKGKKSAKELEDLAAEIASKEKIHLLRMFVDDVTPEKLTSIMSEQKGRAAVLSTESGIFDTLSGIYTQNVNIDAFLKGYSGDELRVDRMGRESETIKSPILTMLLMAQPSVIANVLRNQTFRGRGLTTRFLYTQPESMVGKRKYWVEPMDENVQEQFEQCMYALLEDPYPKEPHVIRLSEEAADLMQAFSKEIEGKILTEYAELSEWAGKLCGNTLRIAGLLCRGSAPIYDLYDGKRDNLIVSKEIMENAIRLGRYFLSHALRIFSQLPQDGVLHRAQRIIEILSDENITRFTRRDIMRRVRSVKRAEDIQPALDLLEEYGYIRHVCEAKTNAGRKSVTQYDVYPGMRQLCHAPSPLCHAAG